MLSCFFAKAQQSSSEQVGNSLQSKFSYRVLTAYQENAATKIEDVFNYFQLLTDTSLNDDTKKEIISNINLVFRNQNPMVIDVTSETLDAIELKKLIQKLLISEPIVFKIVNQNKFNFITSNSWENNYTIIRTKSGKNKSFAVYQTIFMIQEVKQFGSSTKSVWINFLGDIVTHN